MTFNAGHRPALRLTRWVPDLFTSLRIEVADKNQRSARQVSEAILAAPARAGAGHGQGQGHGGGGGGAGGGPGRKTSQQFCADEGIDVTNARAHLQAKGLKASATQTMREIAMNKGYDRPYELMDLLRTK